MARSLPVRGAWIEIYAGDIQEAEDASLPVRGAWIEIFRTLREGERFNVAPRKGSVD